MKTCPEVSVACVPYILARCELGNELCPTNKNVLPLNAVNDLNCRLNNLLADFSHCDTKTLSVLFRTYCMNVMAVKYGHLIRPI